jgi:hypothetical protein
VVRLSLARRVENRGLARGRRHLVIVARRVDELGGRDMEAGGVCVCEGDSGAGKRGHYFLLQGVGTGATGSCRRNRDGLRGRG